MNLVIAVITFALALQPSLSVAENRHDNKDYMFGFKTPCSFYGGPSIFDVCHQISAQNQISRAGSYDVIYTCLTCYGSHLRLDNYVKKMVVPKNFINL